MKKLAIILPLLTLASCASIFNTQAIEKTSVVDEKSKLKIIEKENQKIIFIGMHHVGRKEFYDDVSNKIDSLQKLGYTVFYESLVDTKNTDSLITVKSIMKLRKLIGFVPNKYLDTTTNIILGKIKYKGAYRLINQPKYSNLSMDSLNSIKADVGITELIDVFEKNNEEVKLDSCDYEFNIKDKSYKCKKPKKRLRKIFERAYIRSYRDKYLAKKINKSNNAKVVVIFGDAHFWGMYKELKLLDNNYKFIK